MFSHTRTQEPRPASQAPAREAPAAAPGHGPRPAARVAAAVVAVLAAVGVWATWSIFVATARGQRVDNLAFDGAVHGQGTLWTVAEPVLDIVSVAFVVAGIGAAMLVAILRRRWALAAQVAVLVIGANVTTQVAKRFIFDRPELLPGWTGENALPSGHTTVAGSVSAALLLATPRAWRPLVAVLGATYTGATGVSTLVGQWHRPSDVVAALLVVLAWGAAVCAFTPPSAMDVARHPGASVATPGSSVVAGLMLLGALAAGAVVLGAGSSLSGLGWDVPLAPDITAYASGVLGVSSATAATFAILLLVRQATARP